MWQHQWATGVTLACIFSTFSKTSTQLSWNYIGSLCSISFFTLLICHNRKLNFLKSCHRWSLELNRTPAGYKREFCKEIQILYLVSFW
uniref:Uncharacterized protein n=1 Tax=Panstrongylus lignarius TaxID=156445 RepID=A0A224XZ18_9HEMI